MIMIYSDDQKSQLMLMGQQKILEALAAINLIFGDGLYHPFRLTTMVFSRRDHWELVGISGTYVVGVCGT